MIVTIHLSAGFSPPSGMLQPGGYQIPPPQNLYSGVGGHQPSSGPSQLQQGMTKCAHTLSCTAMLFVSKLTVIFFWLTFTTRSIHEGPFYFFFISDHLSMHVPCSNNKMSKEIETCDWKAISYTYDNLLFFCRICSTFWYAASRWIPDSFSTLVQWISFTIYPISSSTR